MQDPTHAQHTEDDDYANEQPADEAYHGVAYPQLHEQRDRGLT